MKQKPARLAFLVLGLSLVAGPARTAYAGPNAAAKLAVHLTAPNAKNACGRLEAHPPCGSIVTTGDLSTPLAPLGYFAYVLVTNGDATAGVAGAQFGIDYLAPDKLGVDIFSWTNCATLAFPTSGWPASGTGTLITWDVNASCQTAEPGGAGSGVIATVGYFYCAAYTPDALRLTARPTDGIAKVASCNAIEDEVPSGTFDNSLGYIMFSPGASVPGLNPCQ